MSIFDRVVRDGILDAIIAGDAMQRVWMTEIACGLLGLPHAVIGECARGTATTRVVFCGDVSLEQWNAFAMLVGRHVPMHAMLLGPHHPPQCIAHSDCEEHFEIGVACWEDQRARARRLRSGGA